MKKYNPHAWVTLIFHAYSRDILRQLFPAMILIAGFSALLNFAIVYYEIDFEHNLAVHSLLGIVLGLFLVFRTNGAYDRWWEGRKHWGSLVNTCRNFANKIDAYLDPELQEERVLFYRLYSNFVFAMKEHLREGVKYEEMEHIDDDFKKGLEEHDHKPNYIVSVIFKHLNRLYREKKISGDQLIVIDQESRELLDILGACERIKNTPIPYSYNLFLKKFVFIYITTLPLALVLIYGYYSAAITALMFYILASTEFIAEEIEDPFGRDDNDLPTDELSAKIKANIKEILIK